MTTRNDAELSEEETQAFLEHLNRWINTMFEACRNYMLNEQGQNMPTGANVATHVLGRFMAGIPRDDMTDEEWEQAYDEVLLILEDMKSKGRP